MKPFEFGSSNEECLWQDIVREVAGGDFDPEEAVAYADEIVKALRKRVPEDDYDVRF